jgi:hypothetical protein
MELIHSWEAASRTDTQEFSILGNSKVYYRVYKSPPLAPILSLINPVHINLSYLRSILILFSHLRLLIPNGICMYSSSPYACYMPCPSSSLTIFILIILGENTLYKSSSIRSFLQPIVILSLFGPNILLSILFSNTLSLCFSLNVRDRISHPYKTTGRNDTFACFNSYVFRGQTGIQNILNWMVASVTRIRSALNFIMSQILI